MTGTYLQETYRMIERSFDVMLPVTIGRGRYYHMTTETSKEAAQKRLRAVHSFRYNAIMRKAAGRIVGPKRILSHSWVIFVSKKKRGKPA